MILMLVLLGLSWLVQYRFRSKAREYGSVALQNNLTGAEIAQKMLTDHGIYDVKVMSAEGQLSDHYNPQNKTVNLSNDVYHGRSIMAAAIAAHECGHAVQHADAYTWLQFRSAIVPIISITSQWVSWILIAGILLLNVFPQLLLIGIIMFGGVTLFSFITLPVEYDASNRAMAWLNNRAIINGNEVTMARNALNWAAGTYLMTALSSLATFLYYLNIYLGRRN